jgi:Mg-chelatase subunit ChlD
MILRNPQLLWLLVPVLGIVGLFARRGAPRRPVVLLRGLLLAVLIVALADPVRPGASAPPAMLVLVDASASVPRERVEAAWQTALAVADSHGGQQTTLAAFGRNVVVAENRQLPAVDGTGSDIAGALRLAGGLLRTGGGRVLLMSDGGATTPGAEAAAAELRAAGVTVDVLPIPADDRPDARVAEIVVPAGLREGQTYRGEIVVVASAAANATLQFTQDDAPASTQPVRLQPGRNSVPFSGTAGRAGVHRFGATLQSADAHPENNTLERTAVVGPPPRVLVVERTPDSAARLRDLLEAGGVQSEARRPVDLPSKLSDLQRFDAVVLQDISASTLSLDQQATLREFVRSLGHGLLTIGGANSYGLGNYTGTPLEEVLPVDMRPPPRRERQAVALLLIIDRSASMFGADPRTSKLEMAKSGAIAATQALMPNDKLGVLVFDTETQWLVPFTTIGEGRSLNQIQNDIASLQFGGGTDIYTALAEGLPEIASQSRDSGIAAKHVVLLTDGRSYANDQGYAQLIAAARREGITLSTIAIGEDADTELLKRLADQGGGRYHFAGDPTELPRLTLKETEIAREDPKVEGQFQPQPHLQGADAHPTLRGFVPRRLPNIGGYVATTLKPTADLILESQEGDAILAGWQYGLGRSLAWTSDDGERWAGSWQAWNESPAFWTQILSYTFPDPTTGPLQTRVETDGDAARIVAEANDPSGAPLDLASVAVRIDDPAGQSQTVRLKQVAPGRYEAPMPAEDQRPGAYQLSAALQKDDQRLEALGGWSQPYPAEFAGAAADPALLGRIAQASGGKTLQSAEEAAALAQAPPARDPLPLWPWLAGAALVLWVVEIAMRRGTFKF